MCVCLSVRLSVRARVSVRGFLLPPAYPFPRRRRAVRSSLELILVVCVCVCAFVRGAAECEDTFMLFDDLAASRAGVTSPASGVSTVDECRTRCLDDDRCAGFNWMRDGRNSTEKCLLYELLIGDVNRLALFDLYVRQRCQQNMFITFGPGMSSSCQSPCSKDQL